MLTKAQGQYQAVVDALKAFPTEFGDSNFVLDVQKVLVDAYAKTGQSTEAQAVLDAMVTAAPDAKQIETAARAAYFAYRGERETLDEAGDPEERKRLTMSMAETLGLANQKASPSYSELFNEAKLWVELEDWEKSKTKLEDILQRFSDGENADKVQRFVTPTLASVQLELGDREACKALLAPLVIGDDALLKSEAVTVTLARAVFGEIVGSGTRVQQVPGVMGSDDELEFLSSRLNTFSKQARDKGAFCRYHARKFDYVHALWVWGQKNESRRGSAKRVLDNYVSVVLLDDRQFTTVDTACAGDDTPAQDKGLFGNDVLSSRYRWLLSRVR